MALNKEHTGVTIRNPSTANLLIDSTDRTSASPADFTIAKPNSILNGFFTRAAVNEVVLQWGSPNIADTYGNDVIRLNVTGHGDIDITFQNGNYTVEDILDSILFRVDLDLSGSGITFELSKIASASYEFVCSNTFSVSSTEGILYRQLGLTPDVATLTKLISNPFILPYRYIDFICNDLTYNQRLKDASTAPLVRDVLYRWMFAWDSPSPLDGYGYPIYQGYVPFVARRALPFPKQIRWEANMPIGNLTFQVYNSFGQLLAPSQVINNLMEWNMTLLVSED